MNIEILNQIAACEKQIIYMCNNQVFIKPKYDNPVSLLYTTLQYHLIIYDTTLSQYHIGHCSIIIYDSVILSYHIRHDTVIFSYTIRHCSIIIYDTVILSHTTL